MRNPQTIDLFFVDFFSATGNLLSRWNCINMDAERRMQTNKLALTSEVKRCGRPTDNPAVLTVILHTPQAPCLHQHICSIQCGAVLELGHSTEMGVRIVKLSNVELRRVELLMKLHLRELLHVTCHTEKMTHKTNRLKAQRFSDS